MTLRFALAASVSLFAGACASLPGIGGADGADGADGPRHVPTTYSAELIRTAYGVPHVIADDHGGIGYGLGKAGTFPSSSMAR